MLLSWLVRMSNWMRHVTVLNDDVEQCAGAGAANDYAKMVEFSRHRREQLKASGQQRRGGGRGGRNGQTTHNPSHHIVLAAHSFT